MDGLLLHGFVQHGTVVLANTVKLIDAAQPTCIRGSQNLMNCRMKYNTYCECEIGGFYGGAPPIISVGLPLTHLKVQRPSCNTAPLTISEDQRPRLQHPRPAIFDRGDGEACPRAALPRRHDGPVADPRGKLH